MGAVKLLCDQLAVPGQDGGGFDNSRDFFQHRLTPLLTNCRQRFPLPITEPYTALDLFAEDPVFWHQILVAQEECLVHRSSNIGE